MKTRRPVKAPTPKSESEIFAEKVGEANRTLSKDLSQDLLDYVTWSRPYHEKRVATFTERLAANPIDAFRWGSDAVTSAAYLEVYALIINNHPGQVLEALNEECERRITDNYNSTSPMANVAESELRVAYVRVTREVRTLVARRADAEKVLAQAEAIFPNLRADVAAALAKSAAA